MLMYVSLDLKDVSVSKNTTEELIMNKRTTPEGQKHNGRSESVHIGSNERCQVFSRLRKTWATNHANLGKDMSNPFFPHANIRASNIYQIQHMKLAGEWGTLHQCCFRVEGMTIDPIISPLFAI